jgi:hypothetical protein
MTSVPETLTAQKTMRWRFSQRKYIAFHLKMYRILQICKIQNSCMCTLRWRLQVYSDFYLQYILISVVHNIEIQRNLCANIGIHRTGCQGRKIYFMWNRNHLAWNKIPAHVSLGHQLIMKLYEQALWLVAFYNWTEKFSYKIDFLKNLISQLLNNSHA